MNDITESLIYGLRDALTEAGMSVHIRFSAAAHQTIKDIYMHAYICFDNSRPVPFDIITVDDFAILPVTATIFKHCYEVIEICTYEPNSMPHYNWFYIDLASPGSVEKIISIFKGSWNEVLDE